MDGKKTIGERIFDVIEKFSPENLDRKIMGFIDRLDAEASKEPLTEQQKENLAACDSWLIAFIVFSFIYFMYLLIF